MFSSTCGVLAGTQLVRYLLLLGPEQGFPTLNTTTLGKVAEALVTSLGLTGYSASSVKVTQVLPGHRRLQQTTTKALLRSEFTNLNNFMTEAQLDQQLQSDAFMTRLAGNLQAAGVTSSGSTPLQVGVSDANYSMPGNMYSIRQQRKYPLGFHGLIDFGCDVPHPVGC